MIIGWNKYLPAVFVAFCISADQQMHRNKQAILVYAADNMLI